MRINGQIGMVITGLATMASTVIGQTGANESIEFLDDLPEETIEQLQEQTGILEDLQYLALHPLDLNKADRYDLQSLQVLSPSEIDALIEYRKSHGPIIHPNELQVVDGIPLHKIQMILPLVTVVDESTLRDAGEGYVLMRSSGYLPKRRGFRSDNGNPPAYQAGPLSLLIKWRHYQSRKYSWGGSLELDAGEKFNFSGQPGFDHFHLHYYKTDRPGWIKTWAIGDYRISLGQGLLQFHGFAVTKSSNPLFVKRIAPVIQPYTGTSEYYYFRGGAVEIATRRYLRNFLFLHFNKRDATIRTSSADGHSYFSALQTDGLHRSQNEAQKKGGVSEIVTGHRIQWARGGTEVGLNTLFQHFSLPYTPVSRIDNIHRLTGSNFIGHSIDFSGNLGSLHYFGEVATQNYRTPAFVTAGLISLHSRLDAGILIRRFPAYFAPIYANAFSARTLPNNESGIYVGLNYHFGPYTRLSFYLDSWKGLWPTYLAHGPTFDQDMYLRLETSRRRKWEAFGQVKFRHRADNQPDNFPEYNTIRYNDQWNIRLQFRKIRDQKWKWTNRWEMVRVKPEGRSPEIGFMGFTDLLWSPIGESWSLACRLAYFHTQSYLSRIYTYEPDILYSFSIPSFYGQGWRLALRGSYKLRNGLRLEMRTGWTVLPGQEEVGSGLNAVPGPFSQQLKLQILYKF